MAISPTVAPIDFEALVQMAQQPVLRYLCAHTGSASEAAELTQETFVRAYCALTRGERPREALPWVFGIARHVFVDALRARRRERRARERMAQVMGPAWQSPWPERVERRVVVAEALEALPPELQEPVLLHYFAGLSMAEIARHLSLTPGAVKTRLWRARQALRGELEALMSDFEQRPAFTLSADLAEKARLIAERPPVYASVSVAMHVGGQRPPTTPMWKPMEVEGQLSLDDVRTAARALHAVRVAGDRPLCTSLELYPMCELFDHPQPVAVRHYLWSASVQPADHQESEEDLLWPTDGWRLGTDPEAPRVLREMREDGLKHLWFTLAGYGATHDELCGRPGAFEAIVTAMRRAREAGFLGGANLILSTRSAPQVRQMAEAVLAGIGEDPNQFMPLYPDAWRPANAAYEAVRPELEDVVGLPPAEPRLNYGKPAFWADPAAHTEGALTRAALERSEAAAEWERKLREPRPRSLSLWVMPNFDLYRQDDGYSPRERVANLRTESAEAIHAKLVALPLSPADPPTYRELAERYGDPEGRKLYLVQSSLNSLLDKWLQQWRADTGLPWG